MTTPNPKPPTPHLVTVVVPARNEAAFIRRCVVLTLGNEVRITRGGCDVSMAEQRSNQRQILPGGRGECRKRVPKVV